MIKEFHFFKKNTLLFFIIISAFACKSEKEVDTLFKLLDSKETGIKFNNALKEDEAINLMSFAPVYNGGGVAIGDLNNDGLEDLFFTGNMVSSRLYINQGELKFKDITESSGLETNVWCNGASIVDINGDGFRDIYIAVSGPDVTKRKNLLYINNGDLTFTEKAAEYGLDHDGYSTHCAFFDYDKDGDLDLYLLTYGNNEGTDLTLVNEKVVDGTGLSTDQLFRNNGNNTFTNVSTEAGITIEGYGLGLAINDFNNDSWPDIYVSNDFLFDDIIYINNQDGTFTDQSKRYLKHTSQFGMGVDIQDFNNDLMPDIVQMDMMPDDNYRQKKILGPMHYNFFNLSVKKGYTPQFMRNSLQLNQGEKGYSEIGQLAGIEKTDWSWAPLFADYDNDGLKDLIITNGFRRNVTDFDFRNYINEQVSAARIKGQPTENIALEIIKNTNDIKLPNYAYKYNGDYTFSDVTQDWGFETPTWSNGMIYADLDDDGDLDIVISNIDEIAQVYQNQSNVKLIDNHFIKVQLKGTADNLDAQGAKIFVTQSGEKQSYYQSKTRGYLSNISSEIHFGLGSNNTDVAIEVIWPNGKLETKKASINQTVAFSIEDASLISKESSVSITNGNLSNQYGLSFFAKESDYVDFYYEPLIPHKLSRQGQAVVSGDINGDGLEDIFVGGAANQSGMLFVQSAKGQFLGKQLENESPYEDVNALFFDADNDGDLDLYVSSGSNEFEANSSFYQDRLYVNDGRGNFKRDLNSIPIMTTSSSSISASDFDGDGDLDLFVGGRLSPKKYPLPGTSYLLLNENGKFKDVIDEVNPNLKSIGMVTASAWADMDQDGEDDLILAGEFMPITILLKKNGKLIDATKDFGLDQTNGWWNSLLIDDIDGDGRLDIMAGNLGENSKLKVSIEKPLTVHAKDYDDNGMIDPIMSHYKGDQEVVLHSKSSLEEQVVAFKKKFLKHEGFAKATFDELLTPKQREGAYILKAQTFEHTAFMNKEAGFNEIELPKFTQIAPLMAIQKIDDKYYLSGNDYSTEVVIGQYDASNGFVLSFENNNFKVDDNSVYRASGDVRKSEKIKVKDTWLIIHTVSNDSLYVSKIN